MISLTTAKLLLFISLCLGPHHGDVKRRVEITNENAYCVWSHSSEGWELTQLRRVIDHWPLNGTNVTSEDLVREFAKVNPQTMRAIKSHDWTHDSVMYFENGDKLEKQGSKIFYTLNAGAPNEQVFTLLIMEKGTVL